MTRNFPIDASNICPTTTPYCHRSFFYPLSYSSQPVDISVLQSCYINESVKRFFTPYLEGSKFWSIWKVMISFVSFQLSYYLNPCQFINVFFDFHIFLWNKKKFFFIFCKSYFENQFLYLSIIKAILTAVSSRPYFLSITFFIYSGTYFDHNFILYLLQIRVKTTNAARPRLVNWAQTDGPSVSVRASVCVRRSSHPSAVATAERTATNASCAWRLANGGRRSTSCLEENAKKVKENHI